MKGVEHLGQGINDDTIVQSIAGFPAVDPITQRKECPGVVTYLYRKYAETVVSVEFT